MKNHLHGQSATRYAACLLAMLLSPVLVHAHVGVGQTSGFACGLGHPLAGLDHFLAMLAVGLWAAQRGGRATWAVPLSFVTVMAIACLAGNAGVALPFVEQGIAASVLVLGLLIVAAIRLPVAASALLVGLFAVFHGHAHGAEMPATASGMTYGTGFVLATALLHGLGLGIGTLIQRLIHQGATRYAGGAVAAIGLYLCLA